MSSLDTDIWDRDDFEEASEYDNSSDANTQGYQDSFEDEIEDWFESYEEEQDEPDFGTSVMESARIRLEQGRLYEMLIKHDLFEGVDAIPEAVIKVQKELKEYIVERLEILLGMKAETQKQQLQQIITPPQFNDVEVQALKMVAVQVTKGASKNAPTTQVTAQVQDVQEQKLNSIKEKPKSLNKMQAAPEKRPNPTPRPSLGRPVQQPVQKKQVAQQPQKRPPAKPLPKAVVEKQSGSVEESAKKDLQYIEKLKTMSLEEANKVVAERHKRPQPPPTNISQDVVNSHYQGKMAINETAQMFGTLLANAKRI
jgi:hypothetical protein